MMKMTRIVLCGALLCLGGCPEDPGTGQDPADGGVIGADGGGGQDGTGTLQRRVGEPCTADGECATGQCVTEQQDPYFAGGYCTLKRCDRVDAACPKYSECRGTARDGQGGTVQICVLQCRTDTGMATCRKGYLCCSGPGPLRTDGWCSPESSVLCLSV